MIYSNELYWNVGMPPKETGKWFLVKNAAWDCPAVMRYYPANFYETTPHSDFFGFVEEAFNAYGTFIDVSEIEANPECWHWFELPMRDEHGCPVLKIEAGPDQP